MIDIKKINNLDKSEFLSIFGNVFEKSKWISEKVFNLKPFESLESFVSEIIRIYENSDNKTVLEILNLHPELAIEKKLTANSEAEQNKANLKECTPEEFNEFKKLNIEYKKKFNFPFIIAVKGKNKDEILNYFRERIKNSLDDEFFEAKKQVKKIATFRLEEIIK
ncbi:MAG: 2-oxo-4-hydroxy-4-carboxy-5-ureidoimidazoline decarboxylase [Pelagibacterales bacterium]|nr:2-oxo-4-hydroxy-4-carboxy-5-ureidoimidazoline decarboxylase [Pelagibacterales bacterium]